MAALITLAAAKAYLGVTTDTQDALITQLITSASAAMANYCNRTLASAPRSDALSGRGKPVIELREWPVTEVSSVIVDGVQVPASPYMLSPGWRMVDDRLLALSSAYIPRVGLGNVQVAYTAGYTPGTIPDDLQAACLQEVLRMYKRRDKIGVASEGLAGQSVSYRSDGLTEYTTQVLASYRRVTWPT